MAGFGAYPMVSCLSCLIGVAGIVLFGYTCWALSTEPGWECDAPLRTWWIVMIVVPAGLQCLGSCCTGCVMASKGGANINSARKSSMVIVGLTALFSVAWMIVGSVWLWTSKDCEEKLPNTYNWIKIDLIFSYCVWPVSLLIVWYTRRMMKALSGLQDDIFRQATAAAAQEASAPESVVVAVDN
eukprot:TRINITY_DN1471_c0_g1_i2.p1 TRINITY_DN1471_c0_g1~~TRINITY_DN1471_c0_g1_i2.p1  ORF type:complete len:207 (+),score=64.55 TRINITY_DN1471_c0_g1_i2:70-621(+)